MSGHKDDMSEMIMQSTLDQIKTLARENMASIPEILLARTVVIAFTIEEILTEMGIERPFDILGFYSEIPFGEGEHAPRSSH